MLKYVLEFDIPSDLRGKFGKLHYFESDPLKDSSQYKTQDLVRIVSELRMLMAENPGLNWIIPMGTDNVAAVMHVITQGVSPQEVNGGVILGAVSNTVASPNRPPGLHQEFYGMDQEPVAVLAQCVDVITHHRKELMGKIALVCKDRLLSPLGLHKDVTMGTSNIQSRFQDFGGISKEDGRWKLDDDEEFISSLLPRGDDDIFLLAHGIEEKHLGISSEYENWKVGLSGQFRNKSLFGNVLVAPGEASLREDLAELRHLAIGVHRSAKRGIPTILVGEPLQPPDPSLRDWRAQEDKGAYAGRFKWVQDVLASMTPGKNTWLIDGGKMSANEACLQIAKYVAEARVDLGLHSDQIAEYCLQKCREYQMALGG